MFISELGMKLTEIKRLHVYHAAIPRSVAEHCYMVALICVDFAALLEGKVQIDSSRLIRRALMHDIPEIVTGDVPYTTKQILKKNMTCSWEEVESGMLGLPEDYPFSKDIWATAEESLEEKLLSLADMLELVKVTTYEARFGNASVSSVLDKAVEVSKRRFEELPKDVICALAGMCHQIWHRG